MSEHSTHPLVKEVPGHLLQFEEKIFGMTLTQLLTDLGMAGVLCMGTAALPLLARVIVGGLAILLTLVLVHGTFRSYTLLYWLYLLGRARVLPRQTVWRSEKTIAAKGEPASVQQTWLPIHALEHGTMSMVMPGKGVPRVTSWVVFEVESAQNVRYLAEAEQVKIYERFKLFLDGLGFPIKCLSLVEQADPQEDTALLAQRQALHHLSTLPRLQRLQQASLAYQQGRLAHCTIVRHFVIVAASTAEVAQMRMDGTKRSMLSVFWRLLSATKAPGVTPEQVRQELRVRISIVKKALQQLDVHAHLLDDRALARSFASCLVPGVPAPSFAVTMMGEPQALPARAHPEKRALWKKRVEGVHGAFSYHSPTAQTHLEPERLCLADLLAPSAVTLHPDVMEVAARDSKRYLRYAHAVFRDRSW